MAESSATHSDVDDSNTNVHGDDVVPVPVPVSTVGDTAPVGSVAPREKTRLKPLSAELSVPNCTRGGVCVGATAGEQRRR